MSVWLNKFPFKCHLIESSVSKSARAVAPSLRGKRREYFDSLKVAKWPMVDTEP